MGAVCEGKRPCQVWTQLGLLFLGDRQDVVRSQEVGLGWKERQDALDMGK